MFYNLRARSLTSPYQKMTDLLTEDKETPETRFLMTGLIYFSSWLNTFLTAILCIVTLLMLFASSLTLSVGLNKWCGLLTQPVTMISE